MSFSVHVAAIDDLRRDIHVNHEFLASLFVTGSAALSGIEGWTDIKDVGDEQLAWLRSYRAFINRVNAGRRSHGQAQLVLDGER